MKRNIFVITLVAVVLIGGVLAAEFWEKKPFSQWKEKECLKLLEKSPWTYEFRWGRVGDIGGNVEGSGPPQPATSTSRGAGSSMGEFDYERESVTIVRLSLFSARPVRQAYVALAAKGDSAKLEKMKEFATSDFGDEIIVAWTLDSKPKRTDALVDLDQQLRSLNVGELKNYTFLATDNGRKVFIKDFVPPTPDGTGAKFIFPRNLEDGTPLITPDVKTFKFQTKKFKMKDEEVAIDGTFKVEKLTFEGKLEY